MSAPPFVGFTPSPDCIRDGIDIEAANVFGAVWRFCQMDHHHCSATVETISNRAGYGLTTTRDRLRRLVVEGWLTAEEHPGKPTTFTDAGRWQLRMVGEDALPHRETVGYPTARR